MKTLRFIVVAGLAAAVPGRAEAPATPSTLVAPAGSKLELMVINEVSTKIARPGDRFPLRLAQPLVVGTQVVIPRGTQAWGEVTDARANGIAGKSGKLATRLLYLDYNGEQLPLTGSPGGAGQGGNLQIVLATLALTPWGLIAKGNNAKLKAGDIVPGFLAQAYPTAAATEALPPTPAPAP